MGEIHDFAKSLREAHPRLCCRGPGGRNDTGGDDAEKAAAR
jgi:hypothetical protein